jgi:hypothetical protein
MALRIAVRLAGLTPFSPRVTMDTRDFETLARRATSWMVGRRCDGVSSDFPRGAT